MIVTKKLCDGCNREFGVDLHIYAYGDISFYKNCGRKSLNMHFCKVCWTKMQESTHDKDQTAVGK